MAEFLPWNPIVGGPNCDKTTTIKALEAEGLSVVHEPARELLDHPRVDIEWLRDRYLRMQEAIGAYAVWMHMRTHYQDVLVHGHDIDRLTDGTALDTLAHLRAADIQPSSVLLEMCETYEYKPRVFLLNPTPWEQDRQRPDEEIARKIHIHLGEVYGEYGYEVVAVPLMTVSERVDLIKNELR